MKKPIKIIDLFAGPGGLGEGFSAWKSDSGEHPFKISLSIEKETSAHKTLQLRAFYRQFPDGDAPRLYYDFLAGKMGKDPETLYSEPSLQRQAEAAAEEARQFTLGEDNRSINHAIEKALGKRPGPWVLIGGPPCQAYSLAGRSRNKGNKNYIAEEDHRNFLYKEYLKVISRFQPAVFVMENVKGLLSAKIAGSPIFDDIQRDLACPAKALNNNDKRVNYTVFSLTTSSDNEDDLFGASLNPKDFIIYAEKYGIPQARHRVILLGIRDDKVKNITPDTLVESPGPTVKNVIGDLPKLRSGLSKDEDTFSNWTDAIHENIDSIIDEVSEHGLEAVAERMTKAIARIGKSKLSRGSNWYKKEVSEAQMGVDDKLKEWYLDQRLDVVCNHETRGHIIPDLHRYLFCACYSQAAKTGSPLTPKADEFPEALEPDHANWKSGHFADRFRVQAANRVATTVTSHISKDGHYFIHYDPTQCRSLTVREAARIQTFPDNYFFVGNRTQQYVQVGNAVPPYLATQIADIVFNILSKI